MLPPQVGREPILDNDVDSALSCGNRDLEVPMGGR